MILDFLFSFFLRAVAFVLWSLLVLLFSWFIGNMSTDLPKLAKDFFSGFKNLKGIKALAAKQVKIWEVGGLLILFFLFFIYDYLVVTGEKEERERIEKEFDKSIFEFQEREKKLSSEVGDSESIKDKILLELETYKKKVLRLKKEILDKDAELQFYQKLTKSLRGGVNFLSLLISFKKLYRELKKENGEEEDNSVKISSSTNDSVS